VISSSQRTRTNGRAKNCPKGEIEVFNNSTAWAQYVSDKSTRAREEVENLLVLDCESRSRVASSSCRFSDMAFLRQLGFVDWRGEIF
jgi:hypothetical protein